MPVLAVRASVVNFYFPQMFLYSLMSSPPQISLIFALNARILSVFVIGAEIVHFFAYWDSYALVRAQTTDNID